MQQRKHPRKRRMPGAPLSGTPATKSEIIAKIRAAWMSLDSIEKETRMESVDGSYKGIERELITATGRHRVVSDNAGQESEELFTTDGYYQRLNSREPWRRG
jgi:hypothetical protein